MVQAVQSEQQKVYSIDLIREEVSQLIQSGVISRQQPIYVLCNYIPVREWKHVESELEQHSFLLRDRVGELISQEWWEND